MPSTVQTVTQHSYHLLQFLVVSFGTLVAVVVLVGLLSPWILRRVINRVADDATRRLFSEAYSKNLIEGLTALRKFGLQYTLENELRAAVDTGLDKPIGTARPFPHFDGLLFSPVAAKRGAYDHNMPVDIHTVIGRRAMRPLTIDMPVMISAMGYGVALNKPFARALAKGSTLAGTTFNAGQGPVLPEFRILATKMVVQYHGAEWKPTEKALAEADMVEIRLGQGASVGAGSKVSVSGLAQDVLLDLGADGASSPLYIPAGIPDIKGTHGFRRLVEQLRTVSRGAPVAMKFGAGNQLESDLQLAANSGVDVVVIDGAQGGTHGSPGILVDDFGIPTLHALCRAVRFLNEHRLREQIDLVVSGGIRTPGEMLKALALGADAVYVGTAALFAATHVQITQALPFEPPTQVAWAIGNCGNQFDEDEAAHHLANFLKSCAEEIQHGIRALGKNSLQQLSEEDLVAWDPEVARITGRPLA